MSMDLDINNYQYDDLLKLFRLRHDFGLEELKNAKKIVLKMHPDKSHLGPEYFLFFSNAYKTLVSVFEFKNKAEKNNKQGAQIYSQTVVSKEDDNGRILRKYLKDNQYEDPRKFNEWFNAQFDKFSDTKEEREQGYGEWLKSSDGLDEAQNSDGKMTKESMGIEFAKRKKELKSVVKYTGVQEMYASNLGGSVLGCVEEDSQYGSELFGGLAFQDIKKAHTETVIAIDEEDYAGIAKFKSVHEYKMHRDSQSLSPLSEKEAFARLKESQMKTEELASKRAYYYAKEVEKNQEKNGMFWAGLKRITGL
jgi:hypothetical protein